MSHTKSKSTHHALPASEDGPGLDHGPALWRPYMRFTPKLANNKQENEAKTNQDKISQ